MAVTDASGRVLTPEELEQIRLKPPEAPFLDRLAAGVTAPLHAQRLTVESPNPTFFESRFDRVWVQSEVGSRIFLGECFSVDLYCCGAATNAPVPGLLGGSSPSAIVRGVVSVVVYTVDRILRARFRSHVGQEGLESRRSLPLRANLDTSASVSEIPGIGWVVAPSQHPGPSHILGTPAADCVSVCYRFGTDASTGDGVSDQTIQPDGHNIATRALAENWASDWFPLSLVESKLLDYCKPFKHLPRKYLDLSRGFHTDILAQQGARAWL